MKEERICPVCGLKMERLSPQSWTCKCGHVEKGKIHKEGEATEEVETEEERLRVRFWEGKKGKVGKEALSHKKVVANKKKRTSVRG